VQLRRCIKKNMKILIVNVNAHTGSTGKISYGLYRYLTRHGHEVKLCCRGVVEPSIDDRNIIAITNKLELYYSSFMSKLTGYEGIHNYFSTKKLLNIIRTFNPDVVQLFNLPGHYVNIFSLLEYLKRHNIKTVYSMMDDYAFAGKCTFVYDCNKFLTECGHCPYYKDYPFSYFFDFSKSIFKRKKRIYQGFNSLTITGVRWSCKMAQQSALTNHLPIVRIDHPINYTEVFYPRKVEGLKEKLGIPSSNIVILTATTALFARKGGYYFVDLAKRLREHKNLTFVFVGYDRTDWELPSNLITIGFVASQSELAEYYSLADVYICTSLADTFPTTCLNALGCGTPIIGFKTGGVPDMAPEPFGKYVEPKDVDTLAVECLKVKAKDKSIIEKTRKYAIASYSEEVIYEKFLNLYNAK